MDGFSVILALLVGVGVGTALGWALARSRDAEARARAQAAEERAAHADERLEERFRSLSALALDGANRRFLELAEGRLKAVHLAAENDLDRRREAIEHLVAPLRETLARVEEQLREVDAGRRAAHAELAQQVEMVRQGSDRLRDQTNALVTALRRPEARGRWGELQLRRVAELAGMAAFCDFEEQATAVTDDGARRPDMVVRLAGGKNIVVDSKVPLAAYLEAVESDSPDVRAARLTAHARHVRTHVDRLAAKTYWAAFAPAPEFVVLFIPGEAFLAPALEHDPELLEYAMSRRVHIATPTTLVSLLRTAQYAWQQEALSRNARQVFELGKQLHTRLATLGGHMDGLGRALSRAVTAYNQTVGSLENRVLVTARRFGELGLVDGDLDAPQGVREQTRPLTAAELLDAAREGRAGTPHAPGGLYGATPDGGSAAGVGDTAGEEERDTSPEVRH
ncbi:DNA recombination protein RmuC [Thermobifida halotolerans]|uniref:DNA recombination protein RmuC n=1 Tax=Thermobifida halotolerans TaxID=483545 RepID=A0A399G1D5_9ACTN|nr:DNA recombination protein RmuC [Thermobifida halotolerans]UOE19557.1 DNA recombination protein RmuC [Thermobifida halotolerans]